MNERPAIVMTEREHLIRAIKDGLRKIDEHDRTIEEQENKREEREVEVGTALKALKAQKPRSMTWEQYLEECGIEIRRSRADQLIRIADGKTTAEEERADTAGRVAKSRNEPPIRIGGENEPGAPANVSVRVDPEPPAQVKTDPEASAEDMKAKFAALDDDQTKQPSRAEVAKLVRAWVSASPETKREFIRERWDEIARVRKQLEANGAAQEDRWVEGDETYDNRT